MAGTSTGPPTRFVCTDCQNIVAGAPPSEDQSQETYDSPEACPACHGTEFVKESAFERRMKNS